MKQYLGFDVGGTSLKVGVVEENARVVYHEKLPFRRTTTPSWSSSPAAITG